MVKTKKRLWLLKQIFSITLSLIWLRIFVQIFLTGEPILLHEPNALIMTAELSITFFTLTYILAETSMYIKEYIKQKRVEVTEEKAFDPIQI